MVGRLDNMLNFIKNFICEFIKISTLFVLVLFFMVLAWDFPFIALFVIAVFVSACAAYEKDNRGGK
jgi:hypothetical protein